MSFYDVKIVGKDVKRFIRDLNKMHVQLYDVSYVDNSAIVRVNCNDLLKIKKIKTTYKIKIIKYYGLARLKYFIRFYYVFLLCLFVGFVFFLILTNLIFEVDVNHNDSDLRNLILDKLSENKISRFNFALSYEKKEKVKKKILDDLHDRLEWIEINRVGTKYVIEVEERKNSVLDLDDTPRNVIASKNGIITKINADHGEIIAKVDQYVKKGDVLISGLIHKKENVVGTVKANGIVYAETWYTVTTELPYHYYEENETGKKTKYIRFSFLDNNLNLFDFKKYRNSISSSIFRIKDFLLPFSFSIEEKKELDIKDNVYTIDNAIKEASELSKKRLKKILGENIEIIYEKNLKYDEINSKIVIVMFYKVIENITTYQNINIQGIEEIR